MLWCICAGILCAGILGGSLSAEWVIASGLFAIAAAIDQKK